MKTPLVVTVAIRRTTSRGAEYGVLADESVPGNQATGSFFLDTDFVERDVADGQPPSNAMNQFDSDDTPSLNDAWGIALVYGAESHSTADNANVFDVGVRHHELVLIDGDNPFGADDQFVHNGIPRFNGDDSAVISMGGDDFYGPGPPSLTGALSFSFLESLAPQLPAFSSVNFGSYRVLDENNQEIGRIEWSMDSVQAVLVPTPVPIPGTAPLAFLALAATGMQRLRRRPV